WCWGEEVCGGHGDVGVTGYGVVRIEESYGMAKSAIIVPSELNQARPSTTSAPTTGMINKEGSNPRLNNVMCTATINEDGDWLSLNVTGNTNCSGGILIQSKQRRKVLRSEVFGIRLLWRKQRPSALLFCSASGDKREKGRGVRGLGLGRMPEVVVCAVVELLWGVEGFVRVERGGLRGLLVELEK
nr:hypothetical protein [Tanacetum cinerariifolium]